MRLPGRRGPGLAASTSWSTMPGSAQAQSALTAGSVLSNSGRSPPDPNTVVPEMMRQGWGRIVNVTTSLGTMLAAGSPTYGPSKAALEALSAIMAKDLDGTGVTVNVL